MYIRLFSVLLFVIKVVQYIQYGTICGNAEKGLLVLAHNFKMCALFMRVFECPEKKSNYGSES